MQRVYLDQNKWIDLGRAHHGRSGGERFNDTLEFLRFGTDQHLVSLPLSLAHYLETWKRGDPASRQRLGTTMYEFSQLDTMAGPGTLTPLEIEAACHQLLGRPATPPGIRVFGKGCGHATGEDAINIDPPDGVDPASRSQWRTQATEMMEKAMIVTPPFQLPNLGIQRPDGRFGERYAEGERHSAAQIKEEGFSKDLAKRFAFASDLLDISKPMNEVFERIGVRSGEIMASQESATAFLAAMPTRWMTANLRRAAHEDPNNKWHANDLNDIAYLAIAAVHCDIVVTEKKWANRLDRLDIEVPATVITDLADLPRYLATS